MGKGICQACHIILPAVMGTWIFWAGLCIDGTIPHRRDEFAKAHCGDAAGPGPRTASVMSWIWTVAVDLNVPVKSLYVGVSMPALPSSVTIARFPDSFLVCKMSVTVATPHRDIVGFLQVYMRGALNNAWQIIDAILLLFITTTPRCIRLNVAHAPRYVLQTWNVP